MKRIVIKLVILPLLGAVVNVAVAWGCALWSGPLDAISEHHPAWDRSTIRNVSFGIDLHGDTDRLSSCFPSSDEPTLYMYTATSVLVGWPARCLRMTPVRFRLELPGIRDQESIHWKVDLANYSPVRDGLDLNLEHLGAQPHRRVPLDPIWSGFAVNTAMYAAALWLLFSALFAPLKLRRHLRRRKGRCLRCGYDLRHAEHEVCPECGSA